MIAKRIEIPKEVYRSIADRINAGRPRYPEWLALSIAANMSWKECNRFTTNKYNLSSDLVKTTLYMEDEYEQMCEITSAKKKDLSLSRVLITAYIEEFEFDENCVREWALVVIAGRNQLKTKP